MHAMQLERFGGLAGIRDLGMLESALGRPEHRWHYEGSSIPRLAAAYAFGIARNHPFVDGNKRAAFLSAYVFLRHNGFTLTASEADAAVVFLSLAAGDIDEDGLTAWFEDNLRVS